MRRVTTEHDLRKGTRGERAAIAGILVLALAVRIAIAVRMPLIGADSARFLRMAHRIAGARISLALTDAYHPLYPSIVGAAYRGLGMPGSGDGEGAPVPPADLPPGAIDADYPLDTGPLEHVALGVDVAIGTLLVGLLYGFTRSMLGIRVASLTAVMAACHPLLARLSADIMSDTTFLAAYSGAFWAIRSGIERRRLAPLAIAGAATGLAYLARPEGAALLACAIGGVVFVRARIRWKLAACIAVLLPCALLAVPYTVHLSAREGGILVTGKKLLPEFFWLRGAETAPGGQPEAPDPARRPVLEPDPAPDPAPPPPPAKGFLRHLPPRLADLCWIGYTFHKALPEALLAGLILAILLGLRIRAASGALILCAAAWAIHAALLMRLLSFVGFPGYLSSRHVLPMVVVALPWAIGGIDAAAGWIAARRLARGLRAGTLSAILVALFAGAHLFPALAPPRRDQLAQKEAGIWLRARIRAEGGGGIVYTTREKVAYYARCPYVPLSEPGARASLEAVSPSPRFLAFYRDRDEIAPGALGLIEAHPERATRIAEFRERSGRVLEIHAWH